MNKTTLLTLVVIGLLVVNLATLGYVRFVALATRPGPPGRHHGPPRGPGRGGPAPLIIRTLELDSAQRVQFKHLRDAHHGRMMQLDGEARRLHQALYQSLAVPVPRPAVADSLMARVAAMQLERERVTIEHFRQLRALCRPEQEKKFAELMAQVADVFQHPQDRTPDGQPLGPPPPNEGEAMGPPPAGR